MRPTSYTESRARHPETLDAVVDAIERREAHEGQEPGLIETGCGSYGMKTPGGVYLWWQNHSDTIVLATGLAESPMSTASSMKLYG